MPHACLSPPTPSGGASRRLLWTVVLLHVARAGWAVAGPHPSFAAVSAGSSKTPGAQSAACIRLRGGSAVQQQQQQSYSVRTAVDEIPENERKPELKRAPSVLVLDEAIVRIHAHPPHLQPDTPLRKRLNASEWSKSTRLSSDAREVQPAGEKRQGRVRTVEV